MFFLHHKGQAGAKQGHFLWEGVWKPDEYQCSPHYTLFNNVKASNLRTHFPAQTSALRNGVQKAPLIPLTTYCCF